jgi:hypothetical protein
MGRAVGDDCEGRLGLKVGKSEDGRWKMEDGRWKMEDGRGKMEDGRWGMGE